MLGRFDCTELFGTVAGRHEILGGGRPFGVHVGCGDDNNPRLDNCISFGSISQSEIIARSTPAPLGYCEEDGGSPPEWIIQRKLFFMNKSKLRNLTLCEAKFLPNVKSGPQFSLLTDDFQQAEGSVLLQNSLTHFRVQINVGSNKCNEYLGKWLLLCFQGDQPQIKPTEICSVQFIMAVKLSGFCSGDQAGGGKISKLSSESRPFIPKSALNFFDHPVPVYCMPENPLLPSSFKRAVDQARALMPLPEAIEKSYRDAISSRSIQAFVDDHPSLGALAPLPMVHSEALDYIERLSLLSALEECHMNISIKSYDIPYASIEFTEQRSTGYVQASEKKIECKLHIKGSQENRPKILLGDVVRLRALPGSCVEGILPDKFEIQGVVKSFRLATEEAVVEFADMPTSYAYVITNTNPLLELNARKYQVRFTFDRCGFGFIQESLQIISAAYNKHLITMLFPNDNMLSPVQLSPTRVNHTFGAGTVPLNGQQMAVVQYLADCATSMKQHYDNPSLYSAHVRPPYVIFGPPGTGKTVTVVESIRQVIAAFPKVKILACAPSDAAADVLCQRLSQIFLRTSLFRLNWWQRIVESVPPYVLPHCEMTSESIFTLPVRSVLQSYSIIVSTCVGAGALRHSPFDIQAGSGIFFDFIFIDEACQALEAEALVPASFCGVNGQIVLAGDQYQLGPQPRSPVYSLTNSLQSLQERILRYSLYFPLAPKYRGSPEYSEIGVPGNFLVSNYRSHKDIFHVSSKLFYGDALLQCGKLSQISSLLGLRDEYNSMDSHQTKADTAPHVEPSPLLFIGCRGTQTHELDSPSYFNDLEITQIISVCAFLLRWSNKNIVQSDIGVIAAYRIQVLKLRISLRKCGLSRINVGSVEDFQGREVRIVIVSTVISDCERLLHEPGLLGLIGDAKRFNVAITRGIAATILVGHPDVLRKDNSFRAFLEYCHQRNGHAGDMWAEDTDFADDDLAEADSLLNITAATALGHGRALDSFGGVDPMEAYYRDDIEWRTLL